MRLASALLAACLPTWCLLAGCATTVPSDAEIPIRSRPASINALHPGWIVTFWGVIYVPDADYARYTAANLTVPDHATLTHERLHAKRQHAAGMLDWHERYVLDRDFRWAEERKAYEAEIAELRARGWAVDRARVLALVLDPGYRGMVSRAAAEAWFDGLAAEER